jgi:hypothetical protein
MVMAYKLTMDQYHEFQATAGVPVVIAVVAPATTLADGYYNGANIPAAADGSITFTPMRGTYFLTIVANPPFPPEPWQVVEMDGAASQPLESEGSDRQLTNLIIVGN